MLPSPVDERQLSVVTLVLVELVNQEDESCDLLLDTHGGSQVVTQVLVVSSLQPHLDEGLKLDESPELFGRELPRLGESCGNHLLRGG